MARPPLAALALFLVLGSGLALYLAGQDRNPPGFYIDEAAISLNALTVAREGRDEYGTPLPLYFRSFDDYKSPTYIYLLAGVFKVLPPSSLTARRLSATLGFLTAVVLALLTWRITGRRWIAGTILASSLATPMLFEISRLVFEVALYPLATALFLLAVWRASRREIWGAAEVISILACLILLTFTYAIGRLFGPLMVICLEILYTRERRVPLRLIAALYVLMALLPMALYDRHHDGAMTRRLGDVSYLSAYILTPVDLAVEFEKHYTANLLPLAMTLEGDPIARHHVQGSGGSILLATFLLAVLGAVEVVRRRGREERWWWFVLAGTLLSLVPASLTIPDGHTLRLSPYPVFLLVLGIPALEAWSQHRRGKMALAVLAIVGCLQAGYFFTRFAQWGPQRGHHFDAGFPALLDRALRLPQRPIYLDGSPVDAQARWHGALRDVERGTFAPLPAGGPEPGSILLASRDPGSGFERLEASGFFSLYRKR